MLSKTWLILILLKNSSRSSISSGLKSGLNVVRNNVMSFVKWFYREIFCEFFVASTSNFKDIWRYKLIVPLLLLRYNNSTHIRYRGIPSCYWCRLKKTLQTDTEVHSQARQSIWWDESQIFSWTLNKATKVNDHADQRSWPFVMYRCCLTKSGPDILSPNVKVVNNGHSWSTFRMA